MPNRDTTKPVPRVYLDGIHGVLRRGRASRFRREARALGLGTPPVAQLRGGLHVQLGGAPLARDLDALVDLLERFDASLTRVEIARDFRAPSWRGDPERQLTRLLRRVHLRALPDRDWHRPDGLACRYLGPAHQELNACAYVRERSKIGVSLSPVLHIEVRLCNSALFAARLHEPGGLMRLEDPHEALAAWRRYLTDPYGSRHTSYTRARGW